MTTKVAYDPDKHSWHPSPLIGQIVLVTTLNADGTSNVAPKSWISMMAFEPSLLALGCNVRHWTGRNILERKEFVINVPGVELAEIVWRSHELPHPRPVEATGLTSMPSLKVKPPRIEECRAHVECMLERHLTYDDELIALGRIVAVSVDEAAVNADDPYAYLRTFVYLEGGTFGEVERSHKLVKV